MCVCVFIPFLNFVIALLSSFFPPRLFRKEEKKHLFPLYYCKQTRHSLLLVNSSFPTPPHPTLQIIPSDQKLSRLVAFIAQHTESKMIVYFNACACVDYFSRVLPLLRPLRRATIIALHGRIAPKVWRVCTKRVL